MRPVWNASETRCDSPPADTGGSILAGSVARNRSAGRYGIHHTKSLPDLSGIVLLARNLHLAGATGLRTAMRRWTEAGRWRCTGYRSFSSRRPIDFGLQVDAFGGDIARVVMFSASWASALIATFSRLRRFRRLDPRQVEHVVDQVAQCWACCRGGQLAAEILWGSDHHV